MSKPLRSLTKNERIAHFFLTNHSFANFLLKMIAVFRKPKSEFLALPPPTVSFKNCPLHLPSPFSVVPSTCRLISVLSPPPTVSFKNCPFHLTSHFSVVPSTCRLSSVLSPPPTVSFKKCPLHSTPSADPLHLLSALIFSFQLCPLPSPSHFISAMPTPLTFSFQLCPLPSPSHFSKVHSPPLHISAM